MNALAEGQAAMVTLAGGVGSRWTRGACVVKALHPFCKFAGKHRSFIEPHLAKGLRCCSRRGAVSDCAWFPLSAICGLRGTIFSWFILSGLRGFLIYPVRILPGARVLSKRETEESNTRGGMGTARAGNSGRAAEVA
jgi:hypothetical protein